MIIEMQLKGVHNPSFFIMADKDKVCDRCGNVMEEIQPCHLRCPNCGSHLDCTDKGSVW